MSKKIRNATSNRLVIRLQKKKRIKRKAAPLKGRIARLIVYRSNKFLYAQVVDDMKGATLAQANTSEEAFKSLGSKKNLEAAKQVGIAIGKRALEKKIDGVMLDRNGYDYDGRVKALADGAREAGLKF